MERFEGQLVADLGYGAKRYVHAGSRAHFHFRLLEGFRICGYRQFPYYCAVFEWAKSERVACDWTVRNKNAVTILAIIPLAAVPALLTRSSTGGRYSDSGMSE